MIYRSIWLVIAAVFGIATSQAPEFTQQYQQRLGGAIDELNTVVQNFDNDAKDNDLSREQALVTFKQSSDSFVVARGESMTHTIERLDRLKAQRVQLTNLPSVARPIALLQKFDGKMINRTWQDYKPAVPVDPQGFIWAIIGFIFGGLGVFITRRGFKNRKRKKMLEPTAQEVA